MVREHLVKSTFYGARLEGYLYLYMSKSVFHWQTRFEGYLFLCKSIFYQEARLEGLNFEGYLFLCVKVKCCTSLRQRLHSKWLSQIKEGETEGVVSHKVAKCHGYDGYIRVKILAGWGKSLGDHAIWQNQAFLGEDLYNVWQIYGYDLA